MPNSEPRPDGRVFDKTNVTLLLVGIAAIGLTALIVKTTPKELPTLISQQAGSQATTSAPSQAAKTSNVVWATSAPGRVEPKGGEVQLRPDASGRIIKVYAAVGQRVAKDDLLAQLRDDEAHARLAQARAEVGVRVGERDEEPETDQLILDRRKAADALGAAERALHNAWLVLDSTYLDRRAGRASDNDVAAARKGIKDAKQNVAKTSGALTILQAKPDAPLTTRLDSGLTLARADLRLAEIAFLNTRIRAPLDGTLLRFDAKIGEAAAPTQRKPIAVLGDMTAIQITAEVPERDVSKVRLGQAVIVRSNAFGDREFHGKVSEIAPTVGSPGLRAQGPRQQLDAEVLEVKIELDEKPPIMPGMRVDVFFKAQQTVSSFINRK